jgi:SAM-dependent methyltransferase
MAQLFTGAGQTAFYKRFRPTYPAQLYDAIYAYAAAHGNTRRDAAADVACGSGQAASELAKAYAHVTALDVSAAQLANATPVPNVAYALGSAEVTGLPPSSQDLLVCAQAMHWFDVPRFYVEAARVLRPRGTLAVWGYGDAWVEGNPPASALVHSAYNDPPLGPHWDARRDIIDGLYDGLDPPSALYDAVERRVGNAAPALAQSWPVEGFVGYVQSWSAYSTYMKTTGVAPGSDADPVPALRARLLGACGVDDPMAPGALDVRWPVVLLLATKRA